MFNPDDFQKQFLASSNTFHKGDPTPVPIGGSRIPESMRGDVQIPPEEKKIISSYGPEYDKLMKHREVINNFKQILKQLSLSITALNQFPKNEVPHLEQRLIVEKEKINKCKSDLNTIYDLLPLGSKEAEVGMNAKELLEPSEVNLTGWNEFVRVANSVLFKRSNELLSQIKAIKKKK